MRPLKYHFPNQKIEKSVYSIVLLILLLGILK